MKNQKHRVLLKKLIKNDQQLSMIESDMLSKNIFQSPSPEHYDLPITQFITEKEIVKRSIVGNPESFIKVANQATQQIRFMQHSTNNLLQHAAKKLKRTTNNKDDMLSSASSSHRVTRKGSEWERQTGNNFKVQGKYDLLKSMKKISEMMKRNEQTRLHLLNKMTISEKIIETHDQRVFEKYRQQLINWDEVNSKIQSKIKQKKHHKNNRTLVEYQDQYRHRIESLQMFDDLKLEESRQPVISWHNRLRSKYTPMKEIQKEEEIRQSQKKSLIDCLPKKKLLDVINPIKLINELEQTQTYDKSKDESVFQELRVNGNSIYQKELESLKKDDLGQQYFLYTNNQDNSNQNI